MMMWQDLVFTLGSSLSIVFLAPTLRDASARIPLGTSLPSMSIGVVYAVTFATLGMTFSAGGAMVTGTMWALIACFRSPGAAPLVDRLPAVPAPIDRRLAALELFARDAVRFAKRRVTGGPAVEEFYAVESEFGSARDYGQAAD